MKNKVIGLIQFLTGIFGVIALVSGLAKGFGTVTQLFQIILGVAMFAGVIYAGNALLNKKKNGRTYSLIAQLLQIISFKAAGIYYKFTGAAFLSLTIENGKFNFLYSGQVADFALSTNATGIGSIQIYLIPLFLFLLLLKK